METPVLGDDSVAERRRQEDQSFWFKTSFLLTKYKILVWLVGAFLLALGFDFKTPAMAMRALQNQIDTLRSSRDTMLVKQNELRRDIRDIKFLACLNHPEQVVCQNLTRR